MRWTERAAGAATAVVRAPKARLAAGLLLCALVAAGCASAPQTRQLADTGAADLPPRAELERVPFFPQVRYQCGPAALATTLVDLGRDVEPDDLVGEVYVPERKGSLRTEMRAAARARGLVPYPLAPELDALLTELAAGRPVLVMQNLGLSWLPRWHYAVAIGYDLPEREIVLRSGRIRRHVTDMSTFERTWARSERWAQVIVPPDTPPTTAAPLPWLEAVRELETTGQTEAARAGYRAATRRWPDSRTAWMARGNADYAAGDHAGARTAFTRALELDPEAADAWNNLAHALADSGCTDAAVEAARCAVRLAPEAPGPVGTLEEIRGMDAVGGGSCAVAACPTDAAAAP